ncbi:hypothetical protein BGZ63DRAFT_413420 [Mariannaea sp. PMI_226]|nr:hypothetical protein BGZ63DRAFT_413420 [Mariannaea sp. PMI_226]
MTCASETRGLETIRQLGKHNPARIYVAARSREKAEAAINELKHSNPEISPLSFLQLDLASFDSIKAAATEFTTKESRLDILMNNAGIMMAAEGLSNEGYEIQFGTNVMGPALFTELLLPTLRETARINPQTRSIILYATSKLADLAKALAEREKGVKIISVHPGMVATHLQHASTGFILKLFLNVAIALFVTPVEKGALSQIWAAVSPGAKNGQYYDPTGKLESGSKLSQNRNLQEELFK